MKLLKLTLASFAFASALAAQTITVAAAANMKYAVTDIANEFTKESGIDVKIITGASGKLTQQIMSGAPYDAFLSADVEYPAKLAKADLPQLLRKSMRMEHSFYGVIPVLISPKVSLSLLIHPSKKSPLPIQKQLPTVSKR